MRLIVESATDYGIFSTDLERRVTIWNSGAERLLGYTGSEVLGEPADLIFTPQDRAAGAPEHEARTALLRGAPRTTASTSARTATSSGPAAR